MDTIVIGGPSTSIGTKIEILKPKEQDFGVDYVLFLALGFAGICILIKIGIFRLIKNIF